MKKILRQAVAISALFSAPGTALASDGIETWFAFLDVCEEVMGSQSDEPMASFVSAPFTFGKPGLKQFSVFSESQSLVAKAVLENDIWERCSVSEINNGRPDAYIDAPIEEWVRVFPSRFPAPEYLQMEHRFPLGGWINPVALRCDDVLVPYIVRATYAFRGTRTRDRGNLVLNLEVKRYEASDDDLCARDGDGANHVAPRPMDFDGFAIIRAGLEKSERVRTHQDAIDAFLEVEH